MLSRPRDRLDGWLTLAAHDPPRSYVPPSARAKRNSPDQAGGATIPPRPPAPLRADRSRPHRICGRMIADRKHRIRLHVRCPSGLSNDAHIHGNSLSPSGGSCQVAASRRYRYRCSLTLQAPSFVVPCSVGDEANAINV